MLPFVVSSILSRYSWLINDFHSFSNSIRIPLFLGYFRSNPFSVTSHPMSGPPLLAWLTLMLSLFLLFEGAFGSEGDRSLDFQRCVLTCASDCFSAEARQSPSAPSWKSWDLALFGWTCQEDCMLFTGLNN